MTTPRVLAILHWLREDHPGVDGGVTADEIRLALELAIRAVALEGAR